MRSLAAQALNASRYRTGNQRPNKRLAGFGACGDEHAAISRRHRVSRAKLGAQHGLAVALEHLAQIGTDRTPKQKDRRAAVSPKFDQVF